MAAESKKRYNIQTLCLASIACIAISAALYWLRDIMIPFVLAVFCSLTVAPAIDFMNRKWRIPRLAGLIIVLLVGIIILWAIWFVVSVSFSQMLDNSQAYQQQIDKLLKWLQDHLPQVGGQPVDIQGIFSNILDNKHDAIGNSILTLLSAVTNLLSKGLLVLIFMMFMLAGKPKLSTRNAKEKLGQFVDIFASARSRVQRYLATKLVTSSFTGILVWLTLWLLNIEMSPVFGLMAFLLNFIPNIGSIIATILPLPVVIATPGVTPLQGVCAIAIPGAIQFFIGNIIEPRLMGKSLGLHPVVILLALIFWGAIWGIIGMLLATPLTATIKIILDRYTLTEKLAWLISDEQ